jgi:hypothetical protein
MFGTISAFFWKHLGGTARPRANTCRSARSSAILPSPAICTRILLPSLSLAVEMRRCRPWPGIAPAAAGWARLRIAPQFGELCDGTATATAPPAGTGRPTRAVEAALSTVAGGVRTRWELQEADGAGATPTAVLSVTVPAGAAGGADVVLPCVGRAAVVTEARSGAVIWRADGFVAAEEGEGERAVLSGERVEHGGVSFRVASGEHRFVRVG